MKSSRSLKKSVIPTSKILLNQIPDWSNWKDAEKWLTLGRKKVSRLKTETRYRATKWSELAGKTAPSKGSPFESFSGSNWRRFVMGVFLADLVSYPTPADQVRFDQLVVAMHRFPEGFTLWWMEIEGQWWPAGYSAWIPIQNTQFNIFSNCPETLADRIVTPVRLKKHPLVYLFNYSVAPLLKKSSFSKKLMTDYVDALKKVKPSGLSCITVSSDGLRIAERFGMKKTGSFRIGKTVDDVYCTPLKSQPNSVTTLPMQSVYQGRVIELWQEEATSCLEMVVGSDRLVFYSGVSFSQLSAQAIDRGALISVTVTSDRKIVSVSKLGGPSEKPWTPHSDSMRWRAKLDGPSRMRKLHQRQEIIRALREYLYKNDFLEIETPLLVKGTCPDTHIETIRTSNAGERGYLVTSTEYQIKRMVVGGFENTYTLTKNFRANDRGRYHSTEFTMLEWARSFGSLDQIEEDAVRFIRQAFIRLYPNQNTLSYQGQEIDLMGPWERITVREAFRKYLGLLDVKDFSLGALTAAAQGAGLSIPEEFKTDPHLVLSFLLDRLQPFLGHRTPTFLREWPAFMTTSARVSGDDPYVAERSELYMAGIEIADGFPFLRDPAQQRSFFKRESDRRNEEGKEAVLLDERYIEALEEGIPPGAGMALGVDRLVMVLTQSSNLTEVQCFSWEEL